MTLSVDTTTLVVGASGATGRLLVQQLLDRGQQVKAIVRPQATLPEALSRHPSLSIVRAHLLELDDAELAEMVKGCHAIASCLGHHMSWKGVFGPPRRLVTDAVRRLWTAAIAAESQTPTRLVLMNIAGNSNRDIHEPVGRGHRLIIGLLRVLVPPHRDNEQAADYLRTEIGQPSRANGSIEWVVVRPDTLTDEELVTDYSVHASPTRSALFDPGSTSRINVAHFMARLITDEACWSRWKGQMPVVYNS